MKHLRQRIAELESLARLDRSYVFLETGKGGTIRRLQMLSELFFMDRRPYEY